MARANAVPTDKEYEIQIEAGTRLIIATKDGKVTGESVYVGIKPGEYIVVTPPQQLELIRVALSNGDTLDIKYLQEGRILEFRTKPIDIITAPVELLLLEFPKTVRERDLRVHKRINCFISGTIEVEVGKNNGFVTGVIKDISKSGCCFQIKASKAVESIFQMNEEITLRCKFPGIAGEREALGRVLDIRKKKDEIAIGIQFSDIMWWVPPYG